VARYTFGVHEFQTASETNFQQFVELVKGRSIISLGDFGPSHLELGLSGQIMLRVLLSDTGIEANCFSTQNPDEPLALALALGDMPAVASVRDFDTKLRGLRTAYAIFYLLTTGREKELASYLVRHPYGDIDKALLSDEETLQVESLSHGSLIAIVRSKAKTAINAVIDLGMMVFPRTRDALLKKLEAEADLKAIEAKRGAVQLERDKFELDRARADYALELVDKIEDPQAKQILHGRLKQAIYDLASGDVNEREIRTVTRRMLPSGRAENDEESGENG